MIEKKGKTWRAKSLSELKVLYSQGIHATLTGQPETPWECPDIKPGKEPAGILSRRRDRIEPLQDTT